MPYSRQTSDYEPVTSSSPRRASLREGEGEDRTGVRPAAPARRAHTAENDDDVRLLAKRTHPAAQISDTPDAETLDTRAAQDKLACKLKRGHLVSFAGLFLFTVVLYFRPYELIPALSSLTSMAYFVALATVVIFVPSQFALEGTFTYRPREVNLVLLLSVAALLSMPFALNPLEAWDTFNKEFIKAVVMFIVMVNVVRTERRLKALFWLALTVSAFLCVHAIQDYSSGRLALDGQRIAGLIGGMFGNPNDLALHLVTIIPIAFGLMLTTRNPFLKLLYAACAVLMVIGNMITFSRGGFLGLMSVMCVLAWKLGRRNRLVVVGLFVLMVCFFAFAPGDYTSRLGSIVDHSRDAFGSAGQRQELLIKSIIVSLMNPVFGVGMGNFHIVSIRELVSHNAYTQVSAEMGIAAMVIYIMFIVTPLRRLRQIERETFATRKGSHFYYLAIGLQGSLIGFMVNSFFASVAYQWYVYYLVGYAICLRRLYEAEVGHRVVPQKKQKKQGALTQHPEDISGETQGDPSFDASGEDTLGGQHRPAFGEAAR
ncbi:MAG TPA: O-antigen ligase family protein [Pyrinomonadaceae bacterium]|nr:O-antigen ligase family protein [Pyrinomonadaceae bacterium]